MNIKFLIGIISISAVCLFAGEKDNIADIDIVPQYARGKLLENGFVITEGYSKQMWNVYSRVEKKKESPFITTDVVLHTAHIFFDYSLRIIENNALYSACDSLLGIMADNSHRQYESANDENIKNLAKLNWAYFVVAKRLIDPQYKIPDEIKDLVNAELNLIDKHSGLSPRPLLTYTDKKADYSIEDYSQYVPRGHYTRSDKFERYFKVMMWLGRIDFKLCPGDESRAKSDGEMMTIQAAMMTQALEMDTIASKLWSKIYQPTIFFVGKSDDPTPDEYWNILTDIFGKSDDVDKFAALKKVDKFIEKAREMHKPKIASNTAVMDDTPIRSDLGAMTRAFRFMGQRFIPDSYIFQRMVWSGGKNLKYTGKDKPFTMEIIPAVGPARAFPRGLDIFAVLGSDEALNILKNDGDTDYKKFDKILNKLRDEFGNLPDSNWVQNLYWRWFGTLKLLVKLPNAENLPTFMKSAAWKLKNLYTALASWAELRHDTILYAKQSYTPMAKSAHPSGPTTEKKRNPKGYVEPYPNVYRKIANMSKSLNTQLDTLSINIPELSQKLVEFGKLCSFLQNLSIRELAGTRIPQKYYNRLRYTGSSLGNIVKFSPELLGGITSDTDKRMDIVADVHSVTFVKKVLEEGVGAPFDIYVLIDDANGNRVCHGAVFSYYEFKWDISDRLTDEKWQKMGYKRDKFRPSWTDRFISK